MTHSHDHGALPPIEGVDPLSAEVFAAFMRSFHLHRQLMSKLLADKDSHSGQAFCLRILATHDGMSQRDLAEALHLSRPTVTTMLQRMEKAGTIVRVDDESDQRLTRVHLTDAGRALEAQIRATFSEYVDLTFGQMSVEDRTELGRLLGVMASNTESALARLGPTPATDPKEAV